MIGNHGTCSHLNYIMRRNCELLNRRLGILASWRKSCDHSRLLLALGVEVVGVGVTCVARRGTLPEISRTGQLLG